MTEVKVVDPVATATLVKAGVETLAQMNAPILDPDTMPELYSSGVQYAKKTSQISAAVSEVLARGAADVEELVAWRLAELWKLGEAATCVVQWVTRGAGIYMTVLVRRANGKLENVIENLMRIPLITKGSRWADLETGKECEVIHFDLMPPAKSLAWNDSDGEWHGGTLEEFLLTHRPDFRDSSGAPVERED